jgi:hypothetical protein
MLAELQLGRFGRLGGPLPCPRRRAISSCCSVLGATGSVGISKEQVQQGNGGVIVLLLAREEIRLSDLPTLFVRDLVDRTARSLSVPGNSWVLTAGRCRQAVFRDLALRLGRYGGQRGDKVR